MDLSQLNEPQREAVLHTDGPILVLAGAGSGKTRVITYRIAHLIEQGTDPSAILAVTFTNKAAGEMRQRAEQLVKRDTRGMWIGTFHSVCARILRMYGAAIGLTPSFVIYDSNDQTTLVSRILKDLDLPDRIVSPSDVLYRIDRAKNNGIGPKDFCPEDFVDDIVAKVYVEYQRRLLAANAADFSDLLCKTTELLRDDSDLASYLSDRFRYLLVDEFQDTNLVQYALIKLLSQSHSNLCVVGDDDQAIYSWRGADIRNILEFEHDHPNVKVVKLEQNYRSTQVVLDAADAIISRNLGRKAKRLWTDLGQGEPIVYAVCADERDEAAFVVESIRQLRTAGSTYGDFAVFYRTHAQSRALEEAMRAAQPSIPHVVVAGTRFYDRAEVKDLLGYLRVIQNGADDMALLRIINVPTRGIGKTTVERLLAAAKRDQISLFEAVMQSAQGQNTELRVGTRKKLAAFATLIANFRAQAEYQAISVLAEAVLDQSGYLDHIAKEGSIEATNRLENIQELLGSMRDYESRTPEPTLVGFLEQVSLASDTDGYDRSEGDVTLMTVHGAKGLEFPIVFLVGLEQGIFPHARSLDDIDQMEEERRLAYVAMTRAKRRLIIVRAVKRWLMGREQVNEASQFISELPGRLVKMAPRRAGTFSPSYTGFSRSSSYGGASYAAPPSPPKHSSDDEVWVDYDYAQNDDIDMSEEPAFRVGMSVVHRSFGVGRIRAISGAHPDVNLIIAFSDRPRTIKSRFVEPA